MAFVWRRMDVDATSLHRRSCDVVWASFARWVDSTFFGLKVSTEEIVFQYI